MNKNTYTKRGFTLIELLVVIAIIGILSAIVIAALGSARTNAKEASILSSLNSARTQAEIYHISNNSYSGLCSDSKIQEIVSSASSTGDGAACYVHNVEIQTSDYGIAASHNDRYYAVSPKGVMTLDESHSFDGSSATYQEAQTACQDNGGYLPTASTLRATYDIDDTKPTGPRNGEYWSSTEIPSISQGIYHVSIYNSTFKHRDIQSDTGYVWCGG